MTASTAIAAARAAFGAAPDRIAYLREHSGLPGPRGNLELLQAAVDVADEPAFRAWLVAGAGTGPTDEYLATCGVVGLGRLVAEGRTDVVEELRVHAADVRWRVREGVAMALQRVGDRDPAAMLGIAEAWAADRPYVQRAAIAGVSEPRLLADRSAARRAVDLVDRVTGVLVAATDRRSDEARTLRQALGYCWSVVVAADPEHGRPAFERWAASGDADVAWIVRENLGKKRLRAVEPAWADRLADQASRGRGERRSP